MSRKPAPGFEECEGQVDGRKCHIGADVARWFCISCDSTYCDQCWSKQNPHKGSKFRQHGSPHERTKREVYERLRPIFEPPEDEHELQKLHQDDNATLWFGVDREDERPILSDTDRYAVLMARTRQITQKLRYPLLVSFVGETGAGKSTLIKMLVSMAEAGLDLRKSEQFLSPVVGSVKNDRSPTSGDVHLYIDPGTAYDELPMLGGETPPKAVNLRRKATNAIGRKANALNTRLRDFKLPTDEKGVRKFAVEKLYPRLLYTFSDVVVFVLRNTRTFESVALRLLLDWAKSSFESSINQPVLPRAIIVLNASDPSMSDDEWDTKTATDRLFEHVKRAIFEGPLKEYYDLWAKKGRTFKETKDLLECYYASITVVRIPTKGRYMLAKQQIDELHRQLVDAATKSLSSKVQANKSLNTDELNLYLQAGFDHFAAKPNEPFNFEEVAIKSNPVPQTFADHILNLAHAVRLQHPPSFWFQTFQRLCPLIASCIVVDCARYNRKGRYSELFDRHYAESCTTALNRYLDRFVQCTFISRKGKWCVNTRLAHDKGHQSSKGKHLGAGPFQIPGRSDKYERDFLDAIKTNVVDLERQMNQQRTGAIDSARRLSIDQCVSEGHRQNLLNYYQSYSARVIDHNKYTCYACLMEVPQHPLPCGHVLFTGCVKMLGRSTDSNNIVTIDSCPLECRGYSGFESITVRFKPAFAGVRVLSLDGGGMRGIVGLEVLRAVEMRLGERLPIQIFFDLIIGTSTGGIIALGLGAKQWSVVQCIERFTEMCTKAFQDQLGGRTPGLKTATVIWHRSKYKSTPFREVLAENFGTDLLRSNAPETPLQHDLKVAVTTTSMPDDRPVLLGNYIRQDEDSHFYEFQPALCMEIWKAAAATSAAPKLFKRFVFEPSCQCYSRAEYLDGALWYNNPVSIANNEKRFLFPDVAPNHPDILLSIGTGMHAQQVQTALQHDPLYAQPSKSPYHCAPEVAEKLASKSASTGYVAVIHDIIKMLSKRLGSILDSELQFKRFHTTVTQHASREDTQDRYIRMNVDLGEEPPDLDETSKMRSLQEKVQKLLKTNSYQDMIENIAHRLIASTFYFMKEAEPDRSKASSSLTYKGRIACRFEGSSPVQKDRMRCLGQYLRRQCSQDFRPFFTIKDDVENVEISRIEMTNFVMDDMVDLAEFNAGNDIKIQVANKQSPVTIYLTLPTQSGAPRLYPISGFPRYFATEDTSTAKLLQARNALIRSRMQERNSYDSPSDVFEESKPEHLKPDDDAHNVRVLTGDQDEESVICQSPPPTSATLATSSSEQNLLRNSAARLKRFSDTAQRRSSLAVKRTTQKKQTIEALIGETRKILIKPRRPSQRDANGTEALDGQTLAERESQDILPHPLPIRVMNATDLIGDDDIVSTETPSSKDGGIKQPVEMGENGPDSKLVDDDSEEDGPPEGYQADAYTT